MWSYAIIFCGHFPDQTYVFSQEETAEEIRGGWYVRQLLGAANIDGGPMFHVISGNLGYQVEHHLFPDMPSTRYGEIAPGSARSASVTACPTTPARFISSSGWCSGRSSGSPFPGGKPRPKPGPYTGPRVRGSGEHEAPELKAAYACYWPGATRETRKVASGQGDQRIAAQPAGILAPVADQEAREHVAGAGCRPGIRDRQPPDAGAATPGATAGTHTAAATATRAIDEPGREPAR